METGVDYPMVLADQFLAAVFRDLAKLFIDVRDSSTLIRGGDDRRFVERVFKIGQFLKEIPIGCNRLRCYVAGVH